MAYTPNKWLLSDLHRRVAAAANQFDRYSLMLRPTRRHVFVRNFKLPDDLKLTEFFSPCFGVLCERRDPDKKPVLVIEAGLDERPLQQAMVDLYNNHGILWASLAQDGNQFVLKCTHGGTEMTLSDQSGNLRKLLAAPISWHERQLAFPQGSLVHSYSERILRDAIEVLSPTYRIECHHQVPVGYVIGRRSDLTRDEKAVLGNEIDAVVTLGLDADRDCAVVLPIKLDIHDSHRNAEKLVAKDKTIRGLCDRVGVPLLTVTPADGGRYRFDCPVLDLEPIEADGQVAGAWADAIAPFLGRAIRYAGQSF